MIPTLNNHTNKCYTADCAMSFFDQLEDIATADIPIRERYYVLRDTFKRIVNQAIALNSINFIGLFAKLDYIIKQHDIPAEDAILIHDTRKVLNAIHDTADNDLTTSLPYDIKATALLVSAINGRMSIPQSLARLFPKKDRKTRWSKIDINMLRVVVNSWDDDYIYVTEEQNASEMKVCYGAQNRYLTHNGKGDWTYLKQILAKDSQLNLVRIRMEENVCMPELIIFEPDYLIDITTIASCFETYAESPYVNMVNRLKPQANTVHIHLGNLAGRFLDDTVHSREVSFGEGVMEFFKANTISLTSCDDMNDRGTVDKFYTDARMQKQNIQRLIGERLPREIDEYDPKAVVLEPTFFSEVLGIQGRLDFLHDKEGRTTIIEQKSGKGAFVPFSAPGFNPNRPEPQEKHLVQLSLYRALFSYEFRKHSDELRHFMLLYSKYSEGLVSIANLPELTLRAIRMRNLLTWCDTTQTSNGLRVLEKLTPEMLNRKGVTGRLWDEWTRPELDRLLSPIHDASPLERAYYFRFMEFVEHEHLLSKVGNKTKDDSGFAAIWLDTLEDKRAAGNIYEELTISSFGQNKDGMVESISLNFAREQSADTSNFRKGDIVILYPYKADATPNACAQMVNRASIKEITTEGVELVLRNSQTDRQVFDTPDGTFWAIEHDMFESSSRALYSAMHSFLSASKQRRDLILSQRQPTIDEHVHMRGEYGAFNTLVERAKQSRDLFLVIGPPGTGKTSFGLLNILKEELTDPHSNVLLLSYTNRAVDEICSKLMESQIDFLRIGSPLNCDEAYHDHLLSERVQQCRTSKEVKDVISGMRVFCATTAALNANIHLFKIKHFDLAVIDESSQILEPHLIGLLSAQSGGRDAISRFVLIGDHKQLPAVVQQTPEESHVDDDELRSIGLTDCRLSLFERLLSNFKTDHGYDPRYVYMLTRQGRMHRDIAEFPNYAFYGNRLEVVPLHHQTLPTEICHSQNGIEQMLRTRRIAFVAAQKPRAATSVKTNQVEAEMIAATVVQIYNICKDRFDESQTVGVIVPYRNQIATIRGAIDRYGIGVLHNITIDTVERYQGSQRDYIIYGFTVQQPYQLNFLTNNVFEEDGMVIDRKLNVAMTRARLHLVLVGNPDILRENYTFYNLLEFVKSKDGYVDVPTEQFCKGDFRMPTADQRNGEDDAFLGNNRDANLVFICYGRSDFSHGMSVYSREEERNIGLTAANQVEIFCRYLMPKYQNEAKQTFLAKKEELMKLAAEYGGHLRMVDVGCGPATCGVALAETMADDDINIEYVGIDVSEEMRAEGERQMKRFCGRNISWRFASSMEEAAESLSDAAQSPTLTIFCFSHFFASIDGETAERLAEQIIKIMASRKEDNHMFVIMQPQEDNRLMAFRAFRKVMNEV
ncbi:AAA domain-containing protein [Prevotella sp.]|uniref:AAA domain-containing protein n=1 Tax=Prevotella sp. TaxID=59823 RepID=UPI0025EC1D0A|nr:AAA domain-containing protein [Prevotella sp.]